MARAWLWKSLLGGVSLGLWMPKLVITVDFYNLGLLGRAWPQ